MEAGREFKFLEVIGTNGKTFQRGVNRDWNEVYTVLELFWNSLDNAPLSIVFYVEMKMEVGVHDIGSRFTPRFSGKFFLLKNCLDLDKDTPYY